MLLNVHKPVLALLMLYDSGVYMMIVVALPGPQREKSAPTEMALQCKLSSCQVGLLCLLWFGSHSFFPSNHVKCASTRVANLTL